MMPTGLKCAAWGAILALAVLPSAHADGIIGSGRGIDHMGIAVRDLGAATRDFNALGFAVRPGGRFPGGLSNALAYLDDGFYLEILGVAAQHSKDNNDIADFAKKHEGAMFLGINVGSAKAAVELLRSRKFDATGPDPGSIMTGNQTKPPPPMWYDVYTQDKPAKGKRTFTLPIFFIQYVNEHWMDKYRAKGITNQPNTATAVRGVWFEVNDLQAKLAELHEGGFDRPSRNVSLLLPAPSGKAIPAGRGTINIVVPIKTGEPASPPVEERIVAISIAVKDLGKARAMARAATKRDLPVYNGTYGKSILIPPETVHGVSIELVQQ